jgi:NADPH:quinone reductase-like Zn-dependent oxidoreductase
MVMLIENWPQELSSLVGSDNKPMLDVVIDSAGGDIMGQVSKILKSGGKVVCYGMYVYIR